MKIPPQGIEAEQSLIGAVLLGSDGLTAAVDRVGPDDFYRHAHAIVWQAVLRLYERSEAADLVTVADELARVDKLEAVGGAAYLAQMVDAAPSAAHVDAYARIVGDKATLRRLIQSATHILAWAYDGAQPVDEILDRAEAAILAVAAGHGRASWTPIYEAVKRAVAVIEDYREHRGVSGVPSDFVDLDRITAGFQPSDLIIIAGRPSMGKTALALNLARNAAARGIPAGFFSLEMSKEQLAMRLLCAEARVDSQKLRTGFLGADDAARLLRAAAVFADLPIYIDDTAALTPLELRARARRIKQERGLGLVAVDYLQLMRVGRRSDNREQEISEISRSLKALAKELEVPVLALSQLNRKVEERHDKRPQLSDLRESGAIEQDADVVMFIYRDEVYNPTSKQAGVAEVLVRKQRNGPTGNVNLHFNPATGRFDNLAATGVA